MEKIRVIICDDEAIARSIIAGGFEAVFAERGIEMSYVSVGNAKTLEEKMKEEPFDLLLLDIDLPGESGIAFGKQLRKANNSIPIVYVSNRKDRVFDSLKINPISFVRKSNLMEDVPTAVDQFLEYHRTNNSEKKLVIKSKENVYSLNISSIRYIAGARNQQMIYADGYSEPISIRCSIQDLENQLTPEGFLRVHKGYLVNFRFICLINDSDLSLVNGEILPISRRKTKEIKSSYLELMQKSNIIL